GCPRAWRCCARRSVARVEGGAMPREPIPTWFFALVVVRKGNQFLVVHERKHGQLWYLPAGRAELGETLLEAARRETLEETGLEGRGLLGAGGCGVGVRGVVGWGQGPRLWAGPRGVGGGGGSRFVV